MKAAIINLHCYLKEIQEERLSIKAPKVLNTDFTKMRKQICGWNKLLPLIMKKPFLQKKMKLEKNKGWLKDSKKNNKNMKDYKWKIN